MDQHLEKGLKGKKHFFDRHASGWDTEHSGDIERFHALIEASGLRPGSTVIEPGCGTGLITELLLEEIGRNGRLYSFDISRQMLEKAKARAPGKRVWFHQADAAHLPLADAIADAVVCFRIFPHIDDQAGALAEFNRVLKPGGLLVIAHAMGRVKLNAYHAGVGGEVARDMIPAESRMRNLLGGAGFSEVSIDDRDERYLVLASKSR